MATNPSNNISVRSNVAKLQIADLKSNFRQHPQSQEVNEGDEVVFTCKPPRGIPKPEVTWKKDNMAVVVGKEDEGGRNFKMADENFGDSEKSEMSFEIGKDFDGQKNEIFK